ncbi:MAG: GDP-L-fucose synthase [Ignavibacteriales bacterium]|nr:GDP-L-fucose synthase [Ignavibacteriales bacterium]
MDRGSKIYVAGHRGLVGSAIVRKLHALDYANITVKELAELDLRERESVDKFFASERPEYVFLAAAKVGGIHANNTYKAEFIYDNIAIAANVVNASHRFGVKKLLNLGSSCIYPKLAPQPLKEEYLLAGPLEATNEPYAIAKIAAIKLCRYYNEQYGTNFISVMPTNLFGPGDNFNLETSHVLPAMMRKLHLARLLNLERLEEIRKDIQKRALGFGIEGTADASEAELEASLQRLGIHRTFVELWGTGNALREFLFSDDLADAVVHLMMHYDYQDIGEFVNIGVGSDSSIKDLANRIKSIVGYTGEIRFDSSKPDGTPRKLLDISRIKALGWTPRIDLDEGLKRLYEWYCAA